MPPNSLVVTHPMVPTKGRCSSPMPSSLSSLSLSLSLLSLLSLSLSLSLVSLSLVSLSFSCLSLSFSLSSLLFYLSFHSSLHHQRSRAGTPVLLVILYHVKANALNGFKPFFSLRIFFLLFPLLPLSLVLTSRCFGVVRLLSSFFSPKQLVFFFFFFFFFFSFPSFLLLFLH